MTQHSQHLPMRVPVDAQADMEYGHFVKGN